MNEIDFDELDRAVSSVLGMKQSTESSNPPSDSSSGPDSTPSSHQVAAPKTDQKKNLKNEGSSAVNSDYAKATESLIQKRSKGRFMDIVPPNQEKKQRQAQEPVSRYSSNIEPLNSPEQTISAATDATKKKSEITEPVSTTSGSTEANLKTKLDNTEAELESLDGLVKDDDQLQKNSPFVIGSSPDKRPLGSGADDDSEESVAQEEKEPVKNIINHEMSQAIDNALSETDDAARRSSSEEEIGDNIDSAYTPKPDEVLPEELRADVMAVESAQLGTVDTKKVADEASSQANVGAIKQQYVEKQTSSQDEADAQVFDTTDYEANKLPKKESSGWLSVLIIVALVIVGAGVGAAAYYFNIFGLL